MYLIREALEETLGFMPHIHDIRIERGVENFPEPKQETYDTSHYCRRHVIKWFVEEEENIRVISEEDNLPEKELEYLKTVYPTNVVEIYSESDGLRIEERRYAIIYVK